MREGNAVGPDPPPERRNDALGEDVSDTDQVAPAVHVSEKLRTDADRLFAGYRQRMLELRSNRPGLMSGGIAATKSARAIESAANIDAKTREIIAM